MTWDNPHWSGRPQETAGPRQKLQPNAYAQLVRFAATHRLVFVLLYAAIALAGTGYALSVLRIDPDMRPRITLDKTTAELQAELDRQFPGIEQTFLAIVESKDPQAARTQALAIADALDANKDMFLSAFVPGTGAFYTVNGLLFRSLEEVRQRVDGLIQMEPLNYAMASAPDFMGFASLVNEIGKAVDQGRSPPGLEAILLAAASAIEAEVQGAPRPVQWAVLAGLDGEIPSERWYVLATPKPGMEREAAAAARKASEAQAGVSWLWPRRALASAPSTARDFVVPAALSIVLTMVFTSFILGSFQQMAALLLGGIVTLACSGAAAAAMGRPLDAATWSFALAVLAPVFVAGAMLCTSFSGYRAKGLSVVQSLMLAGQRRGAMVTVSILLFAVMWLSWLPRQLPSLSHFAVIALIGCVVAWLVSFTLLPAALSLLAAPRPEEEPNWLDDVLSREASPSLRSGLDAAAMVVLAAAIFCAAFLPAIRFGERQLPSAPALIQTPDARGAIHILVAQTGVPDLADKLAGLPEVGAFRTATQFLPPEAPEKIAQLRRLSALTPFAPAFRPPADAAQLANVFQDLDEQLTAIAVGPVTSPALKEAVLRLRRAVTLFAAPEPPTPARVASLEQALFGGLGELSARLEQLARLEVPGVSSLDPRLLRRFVSEQGIWRVEVMPKTGGSELSFAATLRAAVPQAAGEPLISLARNEIIHHETLLALCTALVLAAFLLLAALRNVTGWMLSLAPAATFITLTAALTVTFNVSLNAAMLAGLSAALALLIASSMTVAGQFTGVGNQAGSFGQSIRAALLPPLALAVAVAPLSLSSRPAVAEVGSALAMLLLMAALLSVLLVPAIARWLESLTRSRPRTPRQN